MNSDARRAVARNVARLRQAAKPSGWTQEYLAKRAGVAQRTISNIEKLDHPDRQDYSPTLDVLQRIASVWGLSAWHLMLPLPDDLLQSQQIEKLVECFISVGKEGRENIARIAENEVRYHQQPLAQTDPVKRR